MDWCILCILPEMVKSANGNGIIKTDAFLDPGNSATLCSEHLMEKRHITGKKHNFLLCTMGQVRVVTAYSLIGLKVSDLDCNKFYILSEVLTQKKNNPSVRMM